MKRTFIFKEGNSQKFWNIDIKGTSFTVTYGRLGTTGKSLTKSFEAKEKSQKEANRLIAEKTKKGYKEKTKEIITSKRSSAKKVYKVYKILDWNMEDLRKGCILAGIAHAIGVARYPDLACEHSWDGMSYNAQWGSADFTYCTVSFAGKYCTGAFRKEVIIDIMLGKKQSNINFVPAYKYYENAPENFIKLMETETLQYLLQNRGGIKPFITAAFWGSAEGIYTNDANKEFGGFWENGGQSLRIQAMDTKSAIDEWKDNYEFSDEAVELLKSIYKRYIAASNGITLTKKEIAIIGSQEEVTPEGMEECAISFKEMGIYFGKY